MVLAKDLGLVPTTYARQLTTTCKFNSRGSDTFLQLPQTPVHTNTQIKLKVIHRGNEGLENSAPQWWVVSQGPFPSVLQTALDVE